MGRRGESSIQSSGVRGMLDLVNGLLVGLGI